MRALVFALLVSAAFACGDDDRPTDTGAGDSAVTVDSSASDTGIADVMTDAGDPLACAALCDTTVRCDDTAVLSECVTRCESAPDLPTDGCRDAYRALNVCVGALDCGDFVRRQGATPIGMRPCGDEDSLITAACAS